MTDTFIRTRNKYLPRHTHAPWTGYTPGDHPRKSRWMPAHRHAAAGCGTVLPPMTGFTASARM